MAAANRSCCYWNAIDLMFCVQEMVLCKASRRKLALHIMGANERKQSTVGQSQATSMPTSADGEVATSNGNGAQADPPQEAPEVRKAVDKCVSGTQPATSPSNGVSKPDSLECVEIIDDMWAFKRCQTLFPCIK